MFVEDRVAGNRLRLGLVVLLTASVGAIVAAAGGGEAFWLCVPCALAVSAIARTRAGMSIGAALVLTVAFGAAANRDATPRVALGLLIPAASVAVLLAVRIRWERERDALRVSAFSDPLTGIANRRSLLERVDYEVARHTRAGRSFGLVLLDLDGFKQLNDRYGHPAGDDLLRDVAAALAAAMRDQDTVARIGGDEFCVLAPETDRAGAAKLAARAMMAVSRVTAGVDHLGASAGVALFPDEGATVDALVQAADQRLLEAKRRRPRSVARLAA
jgi:diguanylate cyclase (GGDEF)-like protein